MARSLRMTYSPTHPYVVERQDQEDGSISYEIWDHRPDSYRRVCICSEDYVDDDDEIDPDLTRGKVREDAEMIVRALNLMNGGLP